MRHILLLPLFLLFLACENEGIDNDDTGSGGRDTEDEWIDIDGDSFPEEDDCNDQDAAVFPGADELCNGTDDDCDDEIDEDAVDTSTFYTDADADTYGDLTAPVEACTQPSGAATASTDCDDSSAAIHPGAAELCDAVDHDCDGDATAGATDAITWYADNDDDGFGDSSGTTDACVQPSGYANLGGDCDDNLDTTHPGADELCNSVDDDCSGTPDDNDPVDAVVYYADSDSDGFGDLSAPSAALCAQPSGHVTDSSDCDDSNGAVNPAEDEVCDASNVDEDCSGSADDLDSGVTDPVTWYLDTDSDGFGDLTNSVVACDAPSNGVSDSTDCDDTNGAINPGEAEVCNTVDDDCSGTPDDNNPTGALVYYLDSDTDGYGDPGAPTAPSCSAVAGHVLDSSDCDDADGTVNPGEVEVCDPGDVDEDCSGAADDLDSGVTDALTWFLDTDSDGFGDPSNTVVVCDMPSNGTVDDTDCDDTDGGVSPAATEACGNGIDDDCSGAADEGCPVDHCVTTNITTDETWPASQVHIVDCDIYVDGPLDPLLTIEPGAEVRSRNGTIHVGFDDPGALDAQGVLFTSGESTPAPDDWKGLILHEFTDVARTTLSSSIIEYSGVSNARVRHTGLTLWNTDATVDGVEIRFTDGMGIRAVGGNPTLTNNFVHDNSDNGVFFETDPPTQFSGNQVDDNTGHAVVMDNDHAGGIGPANTAAGNTHDTIWLRGNSLTADATWPAAGMPYLVQDDVVVNNGATLTIGDGAIVEFNLFRSLGVGAAFGGTGAVWIDAPVDGVLFTSHASPATPGDWDGLILNNTFDASTSRIRGLTVEYAGNAGFGAITDYTGDAVIEDCIIRNNADEGIDTNNGALEVRGTTIENNGGIGIYAEQTPIVDLSGNTITNNGGPGLIIWPQGIGGVAADNTFSGNAEDRIEVRAGSLNNNSWVWHDPGVPWLVTGRVHASSNSVLEILPGVTIEFDSNGEILINGTWNNEAQLIIDAAGNPPLLTSAQPTQTPGDWPGLKIGVYAAGSTIDGLDIEFGGSDNEGNMLLQDPVLLRNVDSRYSSNHGVFISSGARPDIADSIFSDNLVDGVHFQANTSTIPDLPLANLTLQNNGGAPLSLCINALPAVRPMTTGGNTFEAVRVTYCGATPSVGNTTIHNPGVPYLMTQRIYIGGTVNIEAGTVFLQEPNTGWIMGQITGGGLFTDGSGAPIVFTSSQPTPAPGDWNGFWAWPGAGSFNMVLDNVVIEFAGGYQGAFESNAANVSIINSRIENSSSYGVFATGASQQPDLTGTTFLNNGSGDRNY